jgi:hypothetical protein
MPLRFAITSRPSRCEEDLHLLADKHARHTKKTASPQGEAAWFFVIAVSTYTSSSASKWKKTPFCS